MTLRAARSTKKAMWFIGLLTAFLLACQITPPGQPQTSALPTLANLPAVSSIPPTTAPTSQPGYAAGSTILDQSSPLSASQGNKAEWPFDAIALQTISINSTLVSGTLEYELSLVDKFGNLLVVLKSTPGVTTESLAEFALPFDGTYQVVLTPTKGDGSVQVVVAALGAASGGGRLEGAEKVGGGMMSTPEVYHTYEFPLSEGDVVTIAAKANAGNAPDTHLTLYGPDGRYITEADDQEPPANLDAVVPGFVATAGGVYTAIVNNVGTAIGAYTFSVTSDTELPEAQGTADIVYDSEYRADFFEGSNLTTSFDGSLGDVISIEVFGPDPDVDVDIYLRSPFGQIIAYAVGSKKGEGETINEVQLPYAGRYQLEFKPTGAGQASFRVNHLITGATGGGDFGDDLSKVLQGNFTQPNVFHFYQFNASAGSKISLVVHSINQDGKLEIGFAVIGPNGQQLVFADDSKSDNPSDPELIDYEVQQTGTFTVIVYSFSDATGTYELDYSRK
jgi:hypothetical protein